MASNVRKASGEAPGAPAAKITPTAVIIIINTSEWLQPSHHNSRADYTDSHSNSSNGNISKRDSRTRAANPTILLFAIHGCPQHANQLVVV
jgi:hypothetical protein